MVKEMVKELTPEQKDWLGLVDSIWEEKLKPYFEEWDAMGGAQAAVRMPGQWVDFWATLRDNGFTGLHIPKAYGGAELGLRTVGRIVEHAAYISYSGSYPFLLTQNECPVEMLRVVGTKDQQARFFRRMQEGGLGAAMTTEPLPGMGLDPVSTLATASPDGKYYIINGQKWFGACNDRGPFGKNFSYTLAYTDRARGTEGISMFLLENNNPGLILGREGNQTGIRLLPRWEARLENCRVPTEDCLGGINNGFRSMMLFTNYVNAEFSPYSVGLASSAIDYTANYTKNRVVFGRPVSDNQSIHFELADMWINTQAGRLLAYEMLELFDRDEKAARRYVTASKVFNGLNAINVTTKCFLMFGGRSYEKGEGHPLERMVRDALASTLGRGFNLERRFVAEALLEKRLPL